MKRKLIPTSAAARYDKALRRGRALSSVPAGCPEPQPTSAWPAENVALLERYREWLVAGGAAESVINHHRIPMAGYVLGLNLKPHARLHLETDLEKGMAYAESKQLSASWLCNCRHSLRWFRRFLLEERGVAMPANQATYGDATRYQAGLPAWLLAQLQKLLTVRRANWRPSRQAVSTYQFWQKYTRVWRWLVEQGVLGDEVDGLTAIRRRHLEAYLDAMLAQGYAVGSVNLDLYNFQGCLRFLQGRGHKIPAALLAMQGLKKPDSLPRFLTDEQVGQLRDDLTARVQTADTPVRLRDRRLDLAAFYLLWQGGLRVCELEDLTLGDVDLPKQRVLIGRSKGLKDRAMYLTKAAASALAAYLELRGEGPDDRVFLYRNKPISRELIRCRMKAAGRRTGVKVTPHMLRHTFGTQLLNAGCRITTIQRLLGHKRLNTTLVYARVHDQTVANDYYTAMEHIEQRLAPQLSPEPEPSPVPDNHELDNSTGELLALVAVLQRERLTDNQQAIVAELQSGLMALAGSPQNHLPCVVNERRQEILSLVA